MTEHSKDNDTVPAAMSDLYRQSATEKPPESLDQAVLAEARHSVRQRPGLAMSWYRPAVFIGLFGLSLALLIEFSILSAVDPETGPETRAVGNPGTETILSPKEECTDEEREDATAWWACIQELEAAGHTGAAEDELQELLSAFPGFRSNAPNEP